jgi:inner membrane protein
MASLFGHALVAVAIGRSYPPGGTSAGFYLLGALCAIVPDADVATFGLGVPYGHVLGHRGFSHSLLFALLLALLVTPLFYRRGRLVSPAGLGYASFFFVCTASHALLDALTNGGLGVAAFAPFDNTRYFLPWRPIQVSPVGTGAFLSEWGWRVLKSEAIWIGIPCVCYILLTGLFQRLGTKGPARAS